MPPVTIVTRKSKDYIDDAKSVLLEVKEKYTAPKYWVLQTLIDWFVYGIDGYTPVISLDEYREPFKIDVIDDGDLKLAFMALLKDDNRDEIEVELFTFKFGHYATDIPLDFNRSCHFHAMPKLWTVFNNEFTMVPELLLGLTSIDCLPSDMDMSMSRTTVNKTDIHKQDYLFTGEGSVPLTFELPIHSIALIQDYRTHPAV